MNKIQKGSFFKHPLIEKILDYPSNIWTFASVSLPLYIYRQNFKVTFLGRFRELVLVSIGSDP